MRHKGSEGNPAAPARVAATPARTTGERSVREAHLLESLADLVGRLDAAADTEECSRAFLDCLRESSVVSRAALYIAGPRRHAFEFHGSFGLAADSSFPPIGAGSAFARWIVRVGVNAPIDDFFAAGGAEREDEAFLAPLVEAGFATAAPLVSRGILAGVLAYAEPQTAGASDEIDRRGDRFLLAASTILAGSLLGVEAALERRSFERFSAVKSDSLDRACRDLRSPLKMLRSALSSLDSDDVSDRVLIDMARGAVSRLEETAAFALSLNAVDAGSSPLSIEKIEVRSLVDDALREIIPELEEKEISISMTDDTAFRSVRVDRGAMATALRSVLAGVVSFAPRGGIVSVSLAVAIEGEGPDGGVAIAGPPGCDGSRRQGAQSRGEPLAVIAIGGGGMELSPIDAASLADPFAFAAASADDRARSFGVGLGVARSIVARHDGVLSWGYDSGRIARFTMRLPVAEQ